MPAITHRNDHAHGESGACTAESAMARAAKPRILERMVTAGMRRYRHRTPQQERYIAEGDRVIEQEALFGRQAPLRLEIGFGHGRFLSQMAASHPDTDFIGIEQNRLRVTKTAHKSGGLALHNVRLFEGDAQSFLRDRLATSSLERVYVLFPDPWPKQRHRRRRLLNRAVLYELARVLVPGGVLVMASDFQQYVFRTLSNCSTLPGVWHNRYQPTGYRFDIPTRFPTVFETHRRRDGYRIAYLQMERTSAPLPPRGQHLPPTNG